VALLERALQLRSARGDRVGAAAVEKLLSSWGALPRQQDGWPLGEWAQR
jgi:hypothetical protein